MEKSESLRLRLCRLRQTLQEQGLQGFIIPRADEHLGDYVPASASTTAIVSL
jgi:Xaa-Pro aminopeptidase